MSLFSITCLVFISVFSVCGCKIDVHQSTRMMQRKVQQSVSVPCSCNISSCPDCGVYYCAAALSNEMHSGAQAIGQGITLKVTERGLNVRQILLLTLLVLLIIYSLLVLGIIICIKTGHIKSLCRGRWRKTQDYSRHVVFSGVVQELYKRNLVHDKIPARCKVSQEKAKSPQTQDKNEDIYQNFEE
ncbi:uncharacterized protein si:ch211-139g16.8 isoform X2 [Triplophysa rosa]|uniref:uncharacterized protein si:ch211-139g16.8 isoform X2 n=1 Tax=Triplophysa rosa TaxID=992332 RepID=UPI002545D98A|nr:uncharacterized protein si:ch211-139g16.8 isoform X2 [Triplophysa rosa]